MDFIIRQDQIADKMIIAKHVSRLLEPNNHHAYSTDRRDQSGIQLAAFYHDRQALIAAIAADLQSANYRLGSAQRKLLKVDKWRIVYQFDFIDRVVMSVLAEHINMALARFLPSNVHSFIRGRSNLKAIRRAANFIRRHHQRASSPAMRELMVWRLDIKNYTDSIPIGEASELWVRLRKLLWRYFENPEWVYAIMRDGLRPSIYDHENFGTSLVESGLVGRSLDGLSSNIIGTTTGSAFAPIAANLYLSKFDEFLMRQDGFYARYGDDVFFAAPVGPSNYQLLKKAKDIIHELTLQVNDSKEKLFLLTGRGPVPGGSNYKFDLDLKLHPVQWVDFLGWQINHRGDYQPKSEKIRRETNVIKRRLLNLQNVLNSAETINSNGQIDLNARSLSLMSDLVNTIRLRNSRADCNFMNRKVTERLSANFQKSLDRAIAQILSTCATSIKGPKTFRHISWSDLVRNFGLKNTQRFFKNKRALRTIRGAD